MLQPHSQRDQGSMLSLWQLLTLFAVVIPIGTAIAVPRTSGGGSVRVAIAVVVGTIVGVACAAALRWMGKRKRGMPQQE